MRSIPWHEYGMQLSSSDRDFLAVPLAGVPWLQAAPIVGQLTLSADVLGGEHPAVYRYAVAAAGSVVLGLALVAAAARLLRRETIVFRA